MVEPKHGNGVRLSVRARKPITDNKIPLIEECEAQIRRLALNFTHPSSRPTFVYFIQVEDDGPIKIGVADNPVRRLDALQSANPSELVLLATVPAPLGLEKFLHDRFHGTRLRGEWFEPTNGLLELIYGLRDTFRQEWAA